MIQPEILYSGKMLRRSFLAALPLLAQAQQAAPTPLDRLRLAVERITQSVNATWGIYVKCLETGASMA